MISVTIVCSIYNTSGKFTPRRLSWWKPIERRSVLGNGGANGIINSNKFISAYCPVSSVFLYYQWATV